MTTLISFLGKSQADPRTGYRLAKYRFDDGQVHEVPFFGLALARHLKVDRLVLVGTEGSMWDAFFDREASGDDDGLLVIMEAVAQDRVTAEMLQAHAGRLSARLGIAVDCLLISRARDDAEQADLLHRLADAVSEGERLAVDVTHSFRHLPMLALVAARYLGKVKGVEMDDIYYGPFEMRDARGEIPVLRLKGMLSMLDWVDAMSSYDKDGDYGVFAPLLVQDGLPKDQARSLEQAAFFERTSNSSAAAQKLAGANGVFASVERHSGTMARLFRDRLVNRINWFRRPQRYAKELALADAYLARGDYLRGAINLQEAWISKTVLDQCGDVQAFHVREACIKNRPWVNREIQQLSYLRNAMAHGVKPDAKSQDVLKLLQDEKQLGARMREIRAALFGVER